MKEAIWVRGSVPSGFWKKPENRHRYMQWLGEKLGFGKPEDWYRITQKDFRRHNGYGFLKLYQRSPSAAVMDYLPGYEWKEWLFVNHVPNSFWEIPDNRHRYMQWLGEKLGYTQSEDWYKITANDFRSHNGAGLLQHAYQNSPSAAVMEYLPDYEWKEWLFNAPLNFWNKAENRRRYMTWLEEVLGYTEPDDWYRITAKDFKRNKGHRLLQYYQDSPLAAIMEYLPEYEWKAWLFVSHVPNSFWEIPDNRYQYMVWLEKVLGYTKPEDWYNITAEDFRSHKGTGILKHYYQNSPSAAVMEYLPEYEWKEWLFDGAPKSFWKNSVNCRHYMQWLGEQLGYKKPDDWYRITANDFKRNKGLTLLKYYKDSPSAIVIACFPEHNWHSEKFSFHKKRQKHLYRIIKKVFLKYDVKWDFKHQEMRFERTNRPMELDIFIPSLSLAFEYQGEQHVLPLAIWGGILALQETQQRDKEKRKACRKYGITLIEVPHSWDGREDTAIEMLFQQFVKQAHDRIKGTQKIQAALKAINIYCQKKQRKQSKRKSTVHQADFEFMV